LTPTAVAGFAGAIGVAAGRDHICAMRADHTVVCRGSNAVGQVAIASVPDAVEISANHNHTCVRDSAGAVSCSGDNYGTAPVAIALPRPALAIAAGTSHDCAITDDHTVWCWGSESFGQLGNGITAMMRESTPQQATLCQ
jgi:alpha-tubulin suppressor-like RCC1 family protein